jgi:hypothetical protein
MELIKNFFMICSPCGRADFTASAVLQAIRSEAPRLHGMRLAYAANSVREKYGIVHHGFLQNYLPEAGKH